MTRKFLFSTCFVLFSFYALQAQRTYFPGSIVNYNGDTTSALISVAEWSLSPTTIRYKAEENAPVQQVSPMDIRAFIIEGKGTFVSEKVGIDQSSNKMALLSSSSDPIWDEQTVFLQVLLSGKTNLYTYKTSNFQRFFFGRHDDKTTQPIEQLVYKRYINDQKVIFYNRQFRSQLWSGFNCGVSKDDLKNISYDQADLIKFFSDYNICQGETPVRYNSYKKKGKVNFLASAGVGFVDGIAVNELLVGSNTSSFNGTSLRADLTVEYTIGSSNPFAFFMNLGFESFNINSRWSNVRFIRNDRRAFVFGDQPYQIKASFGTVGFGVRKYYYFNKDFSFSIGSMLIPGLTFISNSKLDVLSITEAINMPATLELTEDSFLVHRLALHYKKYFIEVRYFSRRELLRDELDFSNRYRSLNLGLGIRLN